MKITSMVVGHEGISTEDLLQSDHCYLYHEASKREIMKLFG